MSRDLAGLLQNSIACYRALYNDIHTACGRYPALPDDIHACGVDDICEPGLANDEAPKPFRFRGFIYPGSYLLSRDLSSDKTPDGCKGG